MKTPVRKSDLDRAKDIQVIIEREVRGVWVSAHDDKGHHYRHRDTGVVVDSVTTQIILKAEHLVPWAAEIAVRDFLKNLQFYDPNNPEQTNRMIEQAKYAFRGVRDDAGNIGTQSHDVFEDYINKWIETGSRPKDITALIPPDRDPRVYATTRSVEKFFNRYEGEIIPIAAELLVGDPAAKTAGTLDLLVLWNGDLWLLDWKTSNSPAHDDYAIQVATYKRLFEKMTGLHIEGASIIGVSKSYDKPTLLDIVRPGAAYNAYLGVSRAYQWLHNGREKLVERKKRHTLE